MMDSLTTGTLAGTGSFQCEQCGYVITLEAADELPACPGCAGRQFARASLFGTRFRRDGAAAESASGLDRIMELAADARIALMCSESRPLTDHTRPRANCHRVGLLGPPLRARGARLVHILPDGGSLEVDEATLPSVW